MNRRIIQAPAAPVFIVATALLSWWLIRALSGSPEGDGGGASLAQAPSSLAAEALGIQSPAVSLVPPEEKGGRQPVRPNNAASGEASSFAVESSQVGAGSTRLDEPGREGGQELVRLLDGTVGPRPASLMDCTFDGGFSCGSCRNSSDCPEGQGCIMDYKKGLFECRPSECEEDSHCFPGSVCRVVAGGPPGPSIRACVLTGQRTEGAPCSRLPPTSADACQEGLLCLEKVCARPCALGASGACPAGHVCQDSPDGPGCIPDCRKLGCSSDQTCVQVRQDIFQCVRLVMDECDEGRPCPSGQNCLVDWRMGRGGRFCASPCESWRSGSCPEGFVCGRGGPTLSSCYRACNPQDLSTCPAGWLCKTVTEDMQKWGCRPDIHH